MSFTHGKNARLWVDQFELTSYFSEFTSAGKAGQAETTVFGKGAKTFIGGLKEGTITGKGFYDPTANTGPDQELTAALGRATNMAVSFAPNGLTYPSVRGIVAYAAETDYNISAPVNNVVAANFSALCDSGLSTGIWLDDPTGPALATAATTYGAPTNLVYSSGATTATITATGSTAAFNAATAANPQTILVSNTTNMYLVSYTGLSGSTFTGCTTLVTLPIGSLAQNSIAQGTYDTSRATTTGGFVANLHVLTFTATGGTTFTSKIQHSADGATFVDLVSFNGGSAISATGAFSAFVAYGTTINQFLRSVTITSAGTTISTTIGVSAARQ